jgi:hypothetical protein
MPQSQANRRHIAHAALVGLVWHLPLGSGPVRAPAQHDLLYFTSAARAQWHKETPPLCLAYAAPRAQKGTVAWYCMGFSPRAPLVSGSRRKELKMLSPSVAFRPTIASVSFTCPVLSLPSKPLLPSLICLVKSRRYSLSPTSTKRPTAHRDRPQTPGHAPCRISRTSVVIAPS